MDNSPTNQLAVSQVADWSTRELDNSRLDDSRTSQLAEMFDMTNSLSASWLVRESSSPRLDWPRVGLSASCPVTLWNYYLK